MCPLISDTIYLANARCLIRGTDLITRIYGERTAAAVPSNRAQHLGSLYIEAKASDLHTEPLILSFSLISRINHRAATLLPSSFSIVSTPPPLHSLFLSLPLCACSNGRRGTGAHASAAEILFRAVEIPLRARFLPVLTTELMNVYVRGYKSRLPSRQISTFKCLALSKNFPKKLQGRSKKESESRQL